MAEPLQVRADHGHRGRSHTRNSAGLAERRRLDLAKSLHHFARQPGDSLIREPARDRPRFIPERIFDVGLLPLQVSMVFDDSFGRGEVVGGRFCVDIEEDVAGILHVGQADTWLPETLDGRNPAAFEQDRPLPKRGQVAVEPVPPGYESRPTVVLYEADFPSSRREPEVRVVDSEQ
jgi:hypothetical protein